MSPTETRNALVSRNGGTDDDSGEIQPQQMMVEGHALQTMRGSYATAQYVQRPRDIRSVTKRVLDEATLSGDDFFYSWRQKGETIEGVSIKGAMILARCWGNCAIEALPVQETASSFIFTSALVDLETGFTLMRQFRQSKASLVAGRHDDERKADIRFQIGQSKAHRNTVVNALPAGLLRKALEAAKSGAQAEMEEAIKKHGLAKVQDLAIKRMAKHSVKEADILRKFGVEKRDALDLEKLVLMKADLKAIEGGEDRSENLYPPTPTDALADKIKAKADEKKPVDKKPDPAMKVRHEDLLARAKAIGLNPPEIGDACERAGIKALAEATPEQLDAFGRELDEIEARQAKE